MRRLLLAALLAAGCGGGTDGTPVAPTTPAPAPPPAPPPEPEPGCTDERERALAYLNSILPREWDGTPFRFDLFDHFPEIAVADYPESQLAVIQELADRIEEQIGYPIIEAGTVIPVPEDMPKDWNSPSIYGPPGCNEWREPGEIHGMHLSALSPGHLGGGAVGAVPWCAVVGYWVGEGSARDPDSAWARSGVVHELFHLFGFGHSLETNPEEAHLGGVPMSPQFTNPSRYGLAIHTPTFEDIDALRCIFPEGG